MRPKFLVKPETWESFDYDKWYAMRISWSVTLFIMLCLEPPKYNNTVLKFTFSLLKDGQRSKKTKNKKRNECFLKMISCSLAKHQKSLVGVTKKITGQRKECRIPFQPNSVTKFWKHKSPPVKSIFFLYFTISSSHITYQKCSKLLRYFFLKMPNLLYWAEGKLYPIKQKEGQPKETR